jgi:hypothetical protein
MSTLSHETVPRRRFGTPDMWASLAIAAMWIVVMVDGVFGPAIKSTDAAGSSTSVPSSIVIGFFAVIGTVAVARRGFGRAS